MDETSEATKASNTKKCPTWPGNKCSPSNFMVRFSIVRQFFRVVFCHPYILKGISIKCYHTQKHFLPFFLLGQRGHFVPVQQVLCYDKLPGCCLQGCL